VADPEVLAREGDLGEHKGIEGVGSGEEAAKSP